MDNRAYKYRIYPNERQIALLNIIFGCVRFIYNYYLALQNAWYEAGLSFLSKTELNNDCNKRLKKAFPWLTDPDKFALTNAIYHLDRAFQNMFEGRAKRPRFKSKKDPYASYTTNMTNGNIAVLLKEKCVKLPKLGKVKAKIHRKPEEGGVIKQATVSREPDGSYYVSVLYAYPAKETEFLPVREEEAIGLDYKSDGLYMDDHGDCCNMPKFYRRMQDVLAKEQRKLSRKVRGSNNYGKQRLRVAKIHRKIARQREDFLRKQAHSIAKNYRLVCVEDLNMQALANKGFGNGKATMDNAWGKFLRYLEEAMKKTGGTLVKVSRWYPSTKTCSKCGCKKAMALTERTYVCPHCGMVMDRDLNAAINIKKEGLRLYHEMLSAA